SAMLSSMYCGGAITSVLMLSPYFSALPRMTVSTGPLLEKRARVRDDPGDGAGGHRHGRTQVDGRAGAAHPADEVAVGGGQAGLAVGQQAGMEAHADPAGGRQNGGPGLRQRRQQPGGA